MKKNNIEKALEGVKLANDLIDLIRKKDFDPEHRPEIHQFLAENRYSEELFNKLSDIDNYTIDFSGRHRDIKRLIEAIERKQRRRRLFRIGWRYAAAILIIAISTLLLIHPNPRTKIVPALLLSYKTPTLLLNDGHRVDLTSVQGDIRTESYIIGNNNSELSYKNADTLKASGTMEYNTIIVPSQFRYHVVLEDGSEVTLNANSQLKFPIKFTGNRREVFLHGEGFFKVNKSAVPFVVTTPDLFVTVYGTRFNINTNIENMIETVLLSGSVGITSHGGHDREIMLEPSEAFIYNRRLGEGTVKKVDTGDYMAWTDGYFRCRKGTLESFTEKLATWYGVEFEYNDPALKQITLTVSLEMKLDIHDILSIIESAVGVKFTKTEGGKYTIR